MQRISHFDHLWHQSRNGVGVEGAIPTGDDLTGSDRATFLKSLDYMGFKPGEKLKGKKIDYVFIGSCTNGRIEDFRQFANYIKGKKKPPWVTAWIVPGSKQVEQQIREEDWLRSWNRQASRSANQGVRLVWP